MISFSYYLYQKGYFLLCYLRALKYSFSFLPNYIKLLLVGFKNWRPCWEGACSIPRFRYTNCSWVWCLKKDRDQLLSISKVSIPKLCHNWWTESIWGQSITVEIDESLMSTRKNIQAVFQCKIGYWVEFVRKSVNDFK